MNRTDSALKQQNRSKMRNVCMYSTWLFMHWHIGAIVYMEAYMRPLNPVKIHSVLTYLFLFKLIKHCVSCQMAPYLFSSHLSCLVDLMAKVNASPKKKVQAKLNTTGQLMSPPADPSVNAPRKFSGFTGNIWHLVNITTKVTQTTNIMYRESGWFFHSEMIEMNFLDQKEAEWVKLLSDYSHVEEQALNTPL